MEAAYSPKKNQPHKLYSSSSAAATVLLLPLNLQAAALDLLLINTHEATG
jgi:hypothetical protein